MNITCADLSSEMVRLCRAKDLAAHVKDYADLRFSAGSFDSVYALNCLLRIPRAETLTALREVNRVLTVRGLFYMGAYGRWKSTTERIPTIRNQAERGMPRPRRR